MKAAQLLIADGGCELSKMKNKNKNFFGLIVGIALGLIFLVGANAAEAKPERPARPDSPGKASVAELKEIIKNFQEQKRAFLSQQKEQKSDARGQMREDALDWVKEQEERRDRQRRSPRR